ncbi:MAG: flagellar motor switch protein FliM [Deltaproteobacteria bacterium]|nr:flagellar motor switch protein FliM [Deltaproteobacteria bacterium]
MADQILSQEEIDALLNAMDKGEVDVNEKKKGSVEAAVKPYNLTSQNRMLRDQFDALEEVYDKFCTSMDTSLTTNLQQAVEVEFVSTEMIKYGEFISAFTNPTGFGIFNMEPLIGSALLAMEPKLLFSLIDCMFGGNGKPTDEIKEFTVIEQRMIKRIVVDTLNKMEEAWKVVYPLKFSLKKIESKPEFVHLVNPNELMLIILFSIKGEVFSGNIHWCISSLMLEPIKEYLSSRYMTEKDMENTWITKIQNLLKSTNVTLIAELGKTRKTIGNLLALKVDDVINLPTGTQDLIKLKVENVPKYQGFPGIVKGNNAVEITGLIQQIGGKE